MNRQLRAAIYEQLLIYKAEAPPEALAEFTALPVKDLILCHFGLGLYIRNNCLLPGSRLYELFITSGVTHKDDMSSLMISRWHEVMTGQREAGRAGRKQSQDYVWRVTTMEETGIIRKIDELGRIVLPVEVRSLFDLNEKDPLEIFIDDEGIMLQPVTEERCIFCKGHEKLISFENKRLCSQCLERIYNQVYSE